MVVVFILLVIALMIGLLCLSREEYLSIAELEKLRLYWLYCWIAATDAACSTEREFAHVQYEAANKLVASAHFFARPWLFILRRYELWRIERITRSRKPIFLRASTTVSRSGWTG